MEKMAQTSSIHVPSLVICLHTATRNRKKESFKIFFVMLGVACFCLTDLPPCLALYQSIASPFIDQLLRGLGHF